jgi:hypothetical protein
MNCLQWNSAGLVSSHLVSVGRFDGQKNTTRHTRDSFGIPMPGFLAKTILGKHEPLHCVSV